ncbi:MAG TPA: molybdopterin molybdenumtransferase, partial [Cyanobacteria bacterium UBA8553]|nr:molybdopterin molybdenumtransferase [Cyanobacteria bacterium UBA8553]
MLPVKEAQSIILDLVEPFDTQLDVEVVDLSATSDRILASLVTSPLDFPHWDNSAMDGYAVRYCDVKSCNAEQPAVLEIVEEIPAGLEPQCSIQSGQAARILTGAVMPTGADTVVMQERTRREENRVFILEAPEPQAFVRHQGSFYKAGRPLLQPGITLGAPEIAVLAAAQCTQLSVYRRPRVAILSTGNELVTPDQPLKPGQIVDSNQYALAAFVALSGGVSMVRGIVRDDPELLREAIAQAISSADIVLSTGGVSVGDYDYVEQILAQLGAEIHIRSVAMKPGKPLTFATFPSLAKGESGHRRRVLYFGLPGNPVSALVSCWRLVQPALSKLSGLRQENWGPVFVQAR